MENRTILVINMCLVIILRSLPKISKNSVKFPNSIAMLLYIMFTSALPKVITLHERATRTFGARRETKFFSKWCTRRNGALGETAVGEPIQ